MTADQQGAVFLGKSCQHLLEKIDIRVNADAGRVNVTGYCHQCRRRMTGESKVVSLTREALRDRELGPADRRGLAKQLRAVAALPPGSGPMSRLQGDLEAAADVLDLSETTEDDQADYPRS